MCTRLCYARVATPSSLHPSSLSPSHRPGRPSLRHTPLPSRGGPSGRGASSTLSTRASLRPTCRSPGRFVLLCRPLNTPTPPPTARPAALCAPLSRELSPPPPTLPHSLARRTGEGVHHSVWHPRRPGVVSGAPWPVQVHQGRQAVDAHRQGLRRQAQARHEHVQAPPQGLYFLCR